MIRWFAATAHGIPAVSDPTLYPYAGPSACRRREVELRLALCGVCRQPIGGRIFYEYGPHGRLPEPEHAGCREGAPHHQEKLL